MHMHDPNGPPTPPEAAPGPVAPQPVNRSALLTVFLVVFIDLLGFGIVLPLLPRYAEEFIPAGQSGFVTGLVIGVLMASFSAMQFLFAPLWGRLSDRVGRRPVLLIGLAGSATFYTLFGLASEIPPQSQGWLPIILILLTRIGAGIAGATISTAAAVIADCTPKEKRAHGMALIGAAFGIGFTFGPLIAFAGLQLFKEQPGAPGYIAGVLSLIAFAVAVRKMPETRVPGGPAMRRSWLDVRGLFDTLKTPTVGLLVFTFFLATFSFANFEGTLSLLTKEAFGLTNEQNFLVFAYVGFMLMFAQGFLYRKLVKKLDEVKLVRIGIVCMFLGLGSLAAIAALAKEPAVAGFKTAWFLVTLAVCVTGFAFVNPSLNGLISKKSDPNRQGEVLGINQSFSALARILGPLAGMVLFTSESSHVLPYALAALLLALVLGLLTKVRP